MKNGSREMIFSEPFCLQSGQPHKKFGIEKLGNLQRKNKEKDLKRL